MNSDSSFEALKREADRSREAAREKIHSIGNGIRSEVSNTKSKLRESLDWRAQTSHHPVAAGAIALVAGFAVAHFIRGRSDRRNSKPQMEHFSNGIQTGTDYSNSTDQVYRPHSSGTPTRLFNAVTHSNLAGNLGRTLVGEVEKIGRDLVIPAVVGFLTSKVSTLVDGFTKENKDRADTPQAYDYTR